MLSEVYPRFMENTTPDMSPGQGKRLEKMARLRKYFSEDSPQIHEWKPSDEKLDFAAMSDEDVTLYLAHSA